MKATRRPLILGHRGAPFEVPENTLRSFRLALAHGADGVELDVQLSADGVPVVIHDATVDRTTNGRGRVGELRWAKLADLRSGGEAIPLLAEVAEWAAETGAWLNVEVKAPGAESASLRVLERAGVLERTILSSFHPEVVAAAGRLSPKVRRYLLLEQWDAHSADAVRRVGAGGVCLANDNATADALRQLHSAGLPTIVWTVDDPWRIRGLLDAGVDGVITNRPEISRELQRP